MELFAAALIFLSACTNSSQKVTTETTDQSAPEYLVDVSNLQIGDLSVLPDQIPVLATTASAKEATAIISLKNSGSSAVSISSIQMIQSQGFSIKLNRCGSTLAKGASCQVTVAFSNRGLFTGTYNGALEINSQTLQLSASVAGIDDPSIKGAGELQVTLDRAFVPFSSADPYRTLTVKNIGAGTATSVAVALPAEYQVRYNRCPSVLKPQQSCDVQVMFKDYRTASAVPSSSAVITVTAVSPDAPSLSKAIVASTNQVSTGGGGGQQPEEELILSSYGWTYPNPNDPEETAFQEITKEKPSILKSIFEGYVANGVGIDQIDLMLYQVEYLYKPNILEGISGCYHQSNPRVDITCGSLSSLITLLTNFSDKIVPGKAINSAVKGIYSGVQGMLSIYSYNPLTTAATPIEQMNFDDLDTLIFEKPAPGIQFQINFAIEDGSRNVNINPLYGSKCETDQGHNVATCFLDYEDLQNDEGGTGKFWIFKVY